MGKPSILVKEPERAQAIMQGMEEALANGSSMEAACSAVGISTSLHYNWLERGRNDRKRSDGLETVWMAYLEATTRGRRRAEQTAIAAITQAAVGFVEEREEVSEGPGGTTTRTVRTTRRDWRAAAWWLERALPGTWGQHTTLHVTPDGPKTWNVEGLALPGHEQAAEGNEGAMLLTEGDEAGDTQSDVSADPASG